MAFFRTRPGLILAVVVVVEVVLFVDYHRERWHKALAPLNRPPTRAGEGLVIRSDGLGYYAWLRSLLIDGDWAFDNEFEDHNPLGDYVPPANPRTELGRRRNQWSVGPGCAWALVVVPGHACWRLWGNTNRWPADGYSLPYQLMVGITTLLMSVLGLGLLYCLARRDAGPEASAWAAAFITLGTTIVYYNAIEVSMAHGLGTVAVAGLVWYWRRTYGSTHWRRWLGLGVLLGAAALMRWQLVTFAVLPAGEVCWTRRKAKEERAKTKGEREKEQGERGKAKGERKSYALPRDLSFPFRLSPLPFSLLSFLFSLSPFAFFLGGAWVAFLPQMIAWRSVYGHWLATPLATAHHWTRPALAQVLLARDRGLFSWTPLTLLAFLGALGLAAGGMWRAFSRRGHLPKDSADAIRYQALVVLVAAFGLQVYVLASLLGAQVSLAVSFGFRFFTEALVALVPGLALLLEKAPRPWGRILVEVGCLLVLWNLILISQYRYGWIPADAGADLSTLLANAGRLVWRKRFLFGVQAVLGPMLLGLLAWWGPRKSPAVN